jgi:uncharacterized membrane protein YfhO
VARVAPVNGYDPGWEATIDGAPAPIYRADSAIMATRVPEGSHRIQFRSAPLSARLGFWLSIAGVARLVFAAAARDRERKNR